MNDSLLMAASRAQQAGNLAEAAKLYAAVLNANPRHFKALYELANLHFGAGGFETAERLFEEAARIEPKSVNAHFARGCALQRLKRHEAAIAAYDRALALAPGDVEAWSNRGVALLDLKWHAQALVSLERALVLNPAHLQSWFNRGLALLDMKRFADAIFCFDRVLLAQPDHVNAMIARANALAGARLFDEALAGFAAALAIDPNRVDALGNRAAVLFELKRYADAAMDAERLVAADPDHPYAMGLLLRSRLHVCEWRDLDGQTSRIVTGIANGKRVIQPFALLSVSDSPQVELRCAQIHTAAEFPAQPALWRGESYRHDKIRIAYLSADFSAHATAHLMAGVFEHHDKARFETMALSFGRDDGSAMRARLAGAFDRFADVSAQSDSEAARMLKENEIDIAVDLKGYTQDSRPGILAHRPAPIQAQYLGYPGTMGAPSIDYILADRVVIPEASERYYSEAVVCLPGSYQCNDAARRSAAHMPTRAEAGLPEQGFVFCSFNNVYKILPEVFSVWMRLLEAVEGSVLWLLEDNETALRHLRQEAAAHGVEPGRLVFAPKLPPEDHLARQKLAGLFLDTFPYGAHTTGSDALWMGLPMVTCRGASFASLVPASLLTATGFPELVTSSLAEYEALALKLARYPAALAAIRTKLEASRKTASLFDTARFTRGLETAYVTMWERRTNGQGPKGFTVRE
jgi:predicted O-linked N-acetylglucosamine transferase (SPINDLY family)